MSTTEEEDKSGHGKVVAQLEGRTPFELDGEELDAPAGTLVFLSDPAVKRYARAAGVQPLRYLVALRYGTARSTTSANGAP